MRFPPDAVRPAGPHPEPHAKWRADTGPPARSKQSGRRPLGRPHLRVRRAAALRHCSGAICSRSSILGLVVFRLEAGAARPMAAITVVGHAFVSPAPIGMLLLVERAAWTLAAVAVVGHALDGGELHVGGLGRT